MKHARNSVCRSAVFSSFAAVCPTGRVALPKHSCVWGIHGDALMPPVQHICEWRKSDAMMDASGRVAGPDDFECFVEFCFITPCVGFYYPALGVFFV